MSELKDSAWLAAEEIQSQWNRIYAEGDQTKRIAAIIRKHFPIAVAFPVSGEIPTPRTDAAYRVGDSVSLITESVRLEQELATERAAKVEATKAYQTVKDWTHRLEANLSTIIAACDEHADGTSDATALEKFANELIGLSNEISLGNVRTLKSRAESAEQELKDYIAKTDPLLACVDPTQETPHCGKCMVCLGVRAEAAEIAGHDTLGKLLAAEEARQTSETNAAKMREALETVIAQKNLITKSTEECLYDAVNAASEALASVPAEKPCHHVAGSDGESVGCIYCGKTAEELSAESVSYEQQREELAKKIGHMSEERE